MTHISDKNRPSSLKILVLTSDRYPPIRPAAKALFGEEFSKRGHRVDWLMQAADPATKGGQVEHGNGRVYLASTNSGSSRFQRLKKNLLDIANDLRVIRLALKNRYDIIQAKDKYAPAVLCWLAARISGSRYCYWLAYPHSEAQRHAAMDGQARYPFFYWLRGWSRAFLLYRFLLPRADHVFVQSEQMRMDFAAKGIDPAMMTPVPGSLNLDRVPYRHDDDPGPEGPTILYVGTLIRARRLDFVIRTFAEVVKAVPDARLKFVGEGENPEDEQLLRDEMRRLELDPGQILFVGQVSPQRVWWHIERAAVCLSPYYPSFVLDSTSPTKLIEYMAMARPVVGNRHPEQSMILEESRAGLCCSWSESEFARCIVELLENSDEARDMGRRGRAWVEQNRTNSMMADVVEQQYRAVLDRRDAGHRGSAEPTGGT